MEGELVALLRQVVQLLAAVEDGRDGVVEDDLGLVHLGLHLCHGVDRGGVLVLFEVDVERANESLNLMQIGMSCTNDTCEVGSKVELEASTLTR